MPILLLTATVTPPSAATNLARRDPELRMNDYEVAFKYYLRLLELKIISSIVFAENSSSDLSRLRNLSAASPVNERVEFLSFDGLDSPPENGRGYGEMRLVDQAMTHSETIRRSAGETMIWKVTGRYIIKNLPHLLRTKPGADFYCHCRNLPSRWADMYLMGWLKGAYEPLLRGIAEHLKESSANLWSAEHRFRACVDSMPQQRRIVKRFKRPPDIAGIRGWDNTEYQVQHRAKRAIRSSLAVLAPWVWI